MTEVDLGPSATFAPAIRALDHVVEWFPELLHRLPEAERFRGWKPKRLWVDVARGSVRFGFVDGPGPDFGVEWAWKDIVTALEMTGFPVYVWVEEGSDFLHVVTEWPGDPMEAPAPFKVYAGASPAYETRSIPRHEVRVVQTP